ncbi:MAG: hypothetical protein JRI96_06305 [Deltaproteobacteria bacterium]|nr:hypothetical protein [Deltaproteobacteria bacterium]
MKKDSKLPAFRKNVKDFLLSEEGKITKKDIIKLGSSLAFLATVFTPTQAFAIHWNYFYSAWNGGHYSHSSHSSHSSHGSHCNSRFCG